MFSVLHAVIIYFMVVFGCSYQNILAFIGVEILTAIASFSLGIYTEKKKMLVDIFYDYFIILTGHIFSIIANDVNMAISLATPFIAIQLLFSGFFLDKRTNSISESINFLRYFSIFNYSFNLLMINQWEHVTELNCSYSYQPLCLNTGKDVLKQQNIELVSSQ